MPGLTVPAASHPHVPVLLDAVVESLAPSPGDTLIDGTLGAGGHAEALLERILPGGTLWGIDRDRSALALAGQRLARFGDAFRPLWGRHEEIAELARREDIGPFDGVLLDLGVSSMQLDDAERGFSFRHDAPIDMRMDRSTGAGAAELLATADVGELTRILRDYGDEKRAGAIARAIVRRRAERPITRTTELAALVEKVLGPAARRYRIHPATRTFQALRVATNAETVGLEATVDAVVERLRPGRRVAVISYHSLEDRAVKHRFRGLADRCVCPRRMPVCGCGRENLVRVVTPRPLRPDEDEIGANPRARSARLRVAERLPSRGGD